MSARSRDLLSASLIGAGIMGAGELFYACAASTNADGAYWKDWFDSEKYFTGTNAVGTAHASMGSLRNDVLFLGSAAGITQTSSITWSNNLCHIVGMNPAWPGQRSHRARINASGATCYPLLTVSGYGNTFANIAINQGIASTEGISNVTVTGARNYFKNCHIALYDSSAATVAEYGLVKLGDCSEIGFEGCYFGSDSVTMSSGTMLMYTSDTTIRALYTNCNWVMNAGNAAATFVHVKPGAGKGTSIYKNCSFINNSNTALTIGIASSGLVNTGHQFYMFGTRFAGVTDVMNAAEEAYVLFDSAHAATTGGTQGNSTVGLMVYPDHSS